MNNVKAEAHKELRQGNKVAEHKYTNRQDPVNAPAEVVMHQPERVAEYEAKAKQASGKYKQRISDLDL